MTRLGERRRCLVTMPGMKTYLVGGAVRDQMLGRKYTESDYVVVGSTPEELLALGFQPVGKDFPVFLHPDTGEQYALARTERKTGPGYHGFSTHASPEVTLEEDLGRRDLTINAMARGEDGSLIDPYGGQEDLRNRTLRHVSPSFVEDPLRVLRVARFAARLSPLGFRVAPDTVRLMRQIVESGEMRALVPERIWQETQRALGEDNPVRYFEVLRECGALRAVFPEIEALFGVPQPRRWHPEVDTGLHSMQALEVASDLSTDTGVRFAALVHDLGKALTPRELWPRHVGHEEAGVKLIDALCDRLRVPNEHHQLAAMTARFHGLVHRAAELRPATIVDLLTKADAFRRPDRFEKFLLACEADARGRGPARRAAAYPQGEIFRRARKVTADVRPATELLAGGKGTEIADSLRARRIEAIRSAGTKPIEV